MRTAAKCRKDNNHKGRGNALGSRSDERILRRTIGASRGQAAHRRSLYRQHDPTVSQPAKSLWIGELPDTSAGNRIAAFGTPWRVLASFGPSVDVRQGHRSFGPPWVGGSLGRDVPGQRTVRGGCPPTWFARNWSAARPLVRRRWATVSYNARGMDRPENRLSSRTQRTLETKPDGQLSRALRATR